METMTMRKLFTQRQSEPPEDLRHDIPNEVRLRFLYALQQVTGEHFGEVLHGLKERLLLAYGGLSAPGYVAARQSDDPVIEHFLSCDDQQAVDFIEACFQTHGFWRSCTYPSQENRLVEMANEVFLENGIGYELTPYRTRTTDEDAAVIPGTPVSGKRVETDYPEAIVKTSQYEHEQIVKPALEMLSDPRFQVANTEMLKAHADYRHGKLTDAITSCGAAFESVLKTICDAKGWSYNAEKDTLSALVRTCKDNSLFHGFYSPIFEATGTVRNKLGDAHGRGPKPLYDVEPSHVEHLIQITSAHILLVVKLADL